MPERRIFLDPQRGVSAIMATTDGTLVLVEIHNRLSTLEGGMTGVGSVATRLADIDKQLNAAAADISVIPNLGGEDSRNRNTSRRNDGCNDRRGNCNADSE